MKCFWIYLYIYICTHIYSVCVYNCRISTQILQSFIGSSTSVSRTPGCKVLSCWAKVTAEDKGLAWCTSPCEGPSLLDSGNLQHTAYCMDQSHSSCHRSWHILDHRYHTRHRACTGWLQKRRTQKWALASLIHLRPDAISAVTATCHLLPFCRPFHSNDSLLHFNRGITNTQHSSNT